MQVNVVDVSSLNTHQAKNGRQYQSIEIMYKNDQGQAQSKKLMSFANPAVFKAAQNWAKGDVIHVSTEKDANGYWQWTAVVMIVQQQHLLKLKQRPGYQVVTMRPRMSVPLGK
jgi:hypothetical protein